MLCIDLCMVFFFKQKTAYEMRISDWISDVCSSDLQLVPCDDPHFASHASSRCGNQAEVPKTGILQTTSERQLARQQIKGRRGMIEIGRASCRERVCKYV